MQPVDLANIITRDNHTPANWSVSQAPGGLSSLQLSTVHWHCTELVFMQAHQHIICTCTCQLFLGQRRDIFPLRVPGFLKTTRLCLKISEAVRSIQKTFRKYPGSSHGMCFAKHDVVSNAFLSKLWDFQKKVPSFTHFTRSFCFSHWFELTFFWKVYIHCDCNNSHFSTRRKKLVRKRSSRREIEVFNSQAWDSCLRHESWQVYQHQIIVKLFGSEW